jgi:threonine aldolase
MMDRIADDHRHARDLGARLAAIPGVGLRPEVVETNIVLADVTETGIAPSELVSLLDAAGVRVMERDTSRIRLVTHRLVGDEEIERAAAIVAEVVDRHAIPPDEVPLREGDELDLELDQEA